MTNDPSEVFKHDQQDAAEEMATRDQQAWTMNVETIHADLAMKAAHTKHTNARAAFWSTLAALLGAATFAVWVAIVTAIIWVIFG